MIVISRAIEGVTLNGKEYLLNESGDDVLRFETVEEAKECLRDNGIVSFEGIEFEEEEATDGR